MTTIKISYSGTTPITCTAASLASAIARQSAAIDNTSNLYDDIELSLAFKLLAGATSGQQNINIYVAGSVDGVIYDYPATGLDSAIVLSTNNVRFVAAINIPNPSGAGTFGTVVPSVAAFFNGILPQHVAIIIENQTGVAFSATEGDHTKSYSGIYYTST